MTVTDSEACVILMFSGVVPPWPGRVPQQGTFLFCCFVGRPTAGMQHPAPASRRSAIITLLLLHYMQNFILYVIVDVTRSWTVVAMTVGKALLCTVPSIYKAGSGALARQGDGKAPSGDATT